jgi:hypothetical protein
MFGQWPDPNGENRDISGKFSGARRQKCLIKKTSQIPQSVEN